MYKLKLHYLLNDLVLTHLILLIIYAIIYYYYFNNISYHYILNSNLTEKEYMQNRLINSILLSMNLQTTTGYVDFNVRSPIARVTAISQLLISTIVTLGALYIHIQQ
jgi:hypothetical protein